MSKALLTTAVGSYPKPEWLLRARTQHAAGKLDAAELRRMEEWATAYWIGVQDALGVDIVVDGEQYRGDMATYFAENMEGFTISGLVRSYGNRYYRKPIAVGPVGRKGPITVEWWKWSQSLTSRPLKGMLTGPYTMADWSFNEHYNTFSDFVMAMAGVVHEEVVDLVKAGAKYIQVDEPALTTRPEEMELASRAMAVVTADLPEDVTIITHVCYGDFAAVADHLVNFPVHVLDLEMANSNYDLLELFRRRKTDKIVSMGVVDVHTHRLEPVEEIVQGIKRGLEVFPPEQLWIDPDCGLKTRQVDEAVNKMRNLVMATQEVKRELGIA